MKDFRMKFAVKFNGTKYLFITTIYLSLYHFEFKELKLPDTILDWWSLYILSKKKGQNIAAKPMMPTYVLIVNHAINLHS